MASLPVPTEPLTDGVVILRRFTFDDVPAVTKACQDPEIARWTAGIPAPYTERDARQWISLHDRFWSEEGHAPFAFCDSSNGQLLGSMTLGEIDLAAHSAAAGYWAAPWARNRGATTHALVVICRWGVETLGLERIDLMTLRGNIASERVAQKAGFTVVGMLQDYKAPRAIDPEARYEVTHWMLTERG